MMTYRFIIWINDSFCRLNQGEIVLEHSFHQISNKTDVLKKKKILLQSQIRRIVDTMDMSLS